MLLEKWLGSFNLLSNDKFANIGLLPEEWECASDLCIRVQMLLVAIYFDNYLFNFDKVGNISVFIDSSVQKTGPTPFSSSSSYQNYLDFTVFDLLSVNETLDQMSAPELWNILRLDLKEHVSVPAEIFLNLTLGWEAILLVKFALSLQIACQVVIVGKEKTLVEVRLDFLDHFVNLLLVNLFHFLIAIFVFFFLDKFLAFILIRCVILTISWEKRHELDLGKSVNCRCGCICKRLLVGGQVAHMLLFRCDHIVVQAVNLEDAEETTDFVADDLTFAIIFRDI
mgnify:CR=1 FL=1